MAYNTFSPTITNGLVLYLDAANDKSYSGTGSNWLNLNTSISGTLMNSPIFSLENSGDLAFDGVDEWCSIASNAIFNYGTGDFTWEFWTTLSPLYTWNNYLIDHGTNDGVVHYYSGALKYYNPTINSGGPLYQTGFGSLLTDTWYHIVVSRRSSVTYLYKNGVLSASDSDTHNYITQTVSIGSYSTIGQYTWTGKISNVRIYNGKGLTQDEISQNYNALKNRFI